MAKFFTLLFFLGTLLASAGVDLFEKCSKILDEKNRLSCFDESYETYSKQNTINLQEEDDKKNAKLNIFGLSKKVVTQEPKQVIAQTIKVTSLSNNRAQLQLDNGQVWRSTEPVGRLRFKIGQTVIIAKGAISGYTLKIKDRKGFIRAMRVS
ncbi:MAG: hypothetical protein O3B35_05135 [Proteobacteria bacterium]|nr:hypothetical protein [Pseudomonadota bacterium]